MGLLDMFRRDAGDVAMTRNALDEAAQGGDDHAITGLIQRILSIGIDGRAPFDSAEDVARKAGRDGRPVEEAIDRVVSTHLMGGAAGGFVTSLGGFVTMVAAIPANVFEFYVQATRKVAAIAHLRGYDVSDPKIRTAVLLTLVGSNADQILAKAGVNIAGGALADLATKSLPRSAAMVIQKAIGFRILRGVGEKVFSRFGKAVPVLGGVIGAGIDYAMMRQIAEQARVEFPQRGSRMM